MKMCIEYHQREGWPQKVADLFKAPCKFHVKEEESQNYWIQKLVLPWTPSLIV